MDVEEIRSAVRATIEAIASRQAEHPGESPHAAAAASTEPPCSRHLVKGTPIMVRPMHADDSPLEADFVRHLSRDTRYKRFMVTLSELPPGELKYLTDVDQVHHVALLATAERDGQHVPVGVVRYIVEPPGTGCEFAIAVDDAWQGSGLAGILMQALMAIARARGLATMEGIVLATNTRMLRFAHQLGFTQERDAEDHDTVRVVRTL